MPSKGALGREGEQSQAIYLEDALDFVNIKEFCTCANINLWCGSYTNVMQLLQQVSSMEL